jgi:hypothetical protein
LAWETTGDRKGRCLAAVCTPGQGGEPRTPVGGPNAILDASPIRPGFISQPPLDKSALSVILQIERNEVKSVLTKLQLSAYRQRVGDLVRKIGFLSSRCLFADELIQGSPTVVYRRCGRPRCRCTAGGDHRHGPYKVIQIVRDKRSRQMCLRVGQDRLWQLAKNYQYQMAKYLELKRRCAELLQVVDEVIDKRLVEFPNDGSKQGR